MIKLALFLSSLAIVLTINANANAAPITLTTANTITFRGPVDWTSVTKAQLKLVEQVKTRGNAKYPLYLVLDSPGGSIAAGQSFIQFAKTINNLHTVTLFSASMAAGIVEALPGRRYITEGGILMFHRASGGFEGQFEDGEIEEQLRLWKDIVRSMEQINADRLGITLAAYKARIANEWWMYGKQAVEQKGADEMADIICSQALVDERETSIQRVFVFVVKREFSGCPLFRAPLPSNKPSREEEED